MTTPVAVKLQIPDGYEFCEARVARVLHRPMGWRVIVACKVVVDGLTLSVCPCEGEADSLDDAVEIVNAKMRERCTPIEPTAKSEEARP